MVGKTDGKSSSLLPFLYFTVTGNIMSGRTVTFPLCLKKIHYSKLLCPQLEIPPFGSVVKVVIGLNVSTLAPRVFLSAWVSVKQNCNNLIHFKYLRPEGFSKQVRTGVRKDKRVGKLCNAPNNTCLVHSTGKQVDHLSGRRPWSRGRFYCCSQLVSTLVAEMISLGWFPTNRGFLLQQGQGGVSLGDGPLTSNHSHRGWLPLNDGSTFPTSVRFVSHIHPGRSLLNVLGSKDTSKSKQTEMWLDTFCTHHIQSGLFRFLLLPVESRNHVASRGFLLLCRNQDLVSPSACRTSW